MSAIETLLGPCPGNPYASAGNAPRTLLMEGDVFIHLQEDESREEITFYSVPGSMQEVEWLSARTEAWSDVLPHPAHEHARCALTVDPATRQVFLSETWPRAAVDVVVLGQLLNEHAARHLLWRDMLRPPERGGAAKSGTRRENRLRRDCLPPPAETKTTRSSGRASREPADTGSFYPGHIPGTSAQQFVPAVGYSPPPLPRLP